MKITLRPAKPDPLRLIQLSRRRWRGRPRPSEPVADHHLLSCPAQSQPCRRPSACNPPRLPPFPSLPCPQAAVPSHSPAAAVLCGLAPPAFDPRLAPASMSAPANTCASCVVVAALLSFLAHLLPHPPCDRTERRNGAGRRASLKTLCQLTAGCSRRRSACCPARASAGGYCLRFVPEELKLTHAPPWQVPSRLRSHVGRAVSAPVDASASSRRCATTSLIGAALGRCPDPPALARSPPLSGPSRRTSGSAARSSRSCSRCRAAVGGTTRTRGVIALARARALTSVAVGTQAEHGTPSHLRTQTSRPAARLGVRRPCPDFRPG